MKKQKNVQCEELLEQTNKKTQSYFTCPIKGEIMLFPITLNCGHTFERESILSWLKDKTNGTCPVCFKREYYHNVCRIENNINMIQLIDEFYGEYRKLKLQTEPKSTTKTYNEISREYLKDDYNEIVGRINNIVKIMLEQGWMSVVPSNENSWNDIYDKITNSDTLCQMIKEYCISNKLELSWQKVDYEEEEEVIMEGKKRKKEKKNVKKHKYVNCRLKFIT